MTTITRVIMVLDAQERILETSDALPGWERDDLLQAKLGDLVDADGAAFRLQTSKGRPKVRVERRSLPGGMQFVDIVGCR